MGRVLTRHELILEASAAADSLQEVSSSGDHRRFADDKVFRYAVAFAWLRLAEPLCRLVTRRLVGEEARRAWSGMCGLRNMLAHERDEDINYLPLWSDLALKMGRTVADIDRLQQGG